MAHEVPEGWYDAGARGMERFWTGKEWTDRERAVPPKGHRHISDDGTAAALCGLLSLVFAPIFVFAFMALRIGSAADEEDVLAQTGRQIGIVGIAFGSIAWSVFIYVLLRPLLNSP